MTVPDPASDAVVELTCAGRRVASYVWRPALAAKLSPRPYLHPVRTLGGTVVTELMPEDHPHHLGVSVAVPDVGGRNFWGGRTFVRGRGPTWLDNHGTQRHLGWTRRGDDGFAETLLWVGPDDTPLLWEERTVATRLLGADAPDCWALDLGFTLTNVSGVPLAIGSPATNGRPGAGYGGFFWRAPRASRDLRAFTCDAAGEDAVHGSRSAWLALSGTGPDDRGWTLVFVAADTGTRDDPWFVRVRDYPGVGSSLAWDRPLPVAPDRAVTRRIVTVVADGALPRDRVRSLASQVTA